MDNIVTAPKTDMFRFRINPEIRRQVEEIYAKNGLTFTQAINIFIQQSINAGGFPFPVSESNGEMMKAKAMERLLAELTNGKMSGDPIPEEQVFSMLEVDRL